MSDFNFDEIYKLYPRKEGRKNGMRYCKKHITTTDLYSQLKTAVINYTILYKEADKKYIKHFSTFMNCWEDYAEIETPLDKMSIRQVISGNADYDDLSSKEREWIQERGGTRSLGSMNNYEFNQLLGE